MSLVSGTITIDGSPAANAFLDVNFGGLCATAGVDGSFVLLLPPGSFGVAVRPSQNNCAEASFYFDVAAAGSATQLGAVSAQPNASCDGAVEGVLTFNGIPITGVGDPTQVCGLGISALGANAVGIAVDGTYSAPITDYNNPDGILIASYTGTILSAVGEARPVAFVASVTTNANLDIASPNLMLAGMAIGSVTVNGVPFVDARIKIESGPSNGSCVRTDASGNFKFPLRVGSYTAKVRAANNALLGSFAFQIAQGQITDVGESQFCPAGTQACTSGFWSGSFDTLLLGDCAVSILQTGTQTAIASGTSSCTVAGNGTFEGTFNEASREFNVLIAFGQPAYEVSVIGMLSGDDETLAGSWVCACGLGTFSLSKTASRSSAQIVAANGGTLLTSVGDVLAVPAGALAADTALTSIVQPVPVVAPAGLVVISHGYQFGPDGTTFSTPVTAVFNYTDADLAGGLLDPSTLRVYVYDTIGQQWQLVGGVVDTVAKTITVSLDHFSQYALFGNMPAAIDGDGDAVADSVDNCAITSNQSQLNVDGGNTAANHPGTDSLGDACDDDTDGDGYTNAQEAALSENPASYCAIMRADVDGDGAVSILDLSRDAQKFGQSVPPAGDRLRQDADFVISILDLSKQASVFGKPVSLCT